MQRARSEKQKVFCKISTGSSFQYALSFLTGTPSVLFRATTIANDPSRGVKSQWLLWLAGVGRIVYTRSSSLSPREITWRTFASGGGSLSQNRASAVAPKSFIA